MRSRRSDCLTEVGSSLRTLFIQIPFQGGTNEEVVKRMYKALHKTDSSRYLKAYW